MTPLKARLEKLLQRLIEIRNELAHAIEDAEEGGIIDESSTKEASAAVVELGGQIQTIEDQLSSLDKQRNYRRNPDVLLQMAKRAWESELSLENAQRYINLLRRSGIPFGEALPMSELRRTKDSRFIKRYITKELNRQFYPSLRDVDSPLEVVQFIRSFRRGSVKADIAMIYYNYSGHDHGELQLSEVIAMADAVNRIIGGEIELVYFQIMGEDSIRIDIEIVQGE